MAGNFTNVGVVALVRGLGQFNSGMQTIRRQMGITGANAKTLSGNMGGLNTSLTGMAQSVFNVGRTIRSFGNELTILGFQLTFLVSGPMAGMVKAASDFESAMVRMTTLANVAGNELDGLAEAALRLAPQVGRSPTELADALFFVTSSGFNAAEALNIVEIAAKGASLGLGETKEVADIVTSALKAFADDGLTASRAMDILVQAVREGKGEVDDLAGTLGRVVGIAAEVGVTFEEATAFIAAFTRVGVPAEVAVTSLRSALTAILKPTEKAKEALSAYGLSVEGLRKDIAERGLADTLITLAKVLGDDDEAFASVFGSARALAGVLITSGPLAQEYAEILANIEASAGVAESAFRSFTTTTEFQLNKAKASLEVFAITVGSILLPGVNKLLEALSALAISLGNIAKENPRLTVLVGILAGIVTAAGPLLIVSGLLIASFGTMITSLGAVLTVLATFVSSLFGLPGLVLAAIGGIAILFRDRFDDVRTVLNNQGQAISNDAYAWGRNVVVAFANGMAAALGAVLRVLTRLGQLIANLLRAFSPPKLLPDLPDWGKAAMESYLEGWLDADLFGIFNQLSQSLESFIRSMELPETDVVPTILAIRLELAKLIDEFRRGGDVAFDGINAILDSIGITNATIRNYIQAMFDLEAATARVEAAQDNLNRVQERYSELLKPIDDQLSAIEQERQAFLDEQRIKQLREIIDDVNAPPEAKRFAALELREIELKKQKKAIEDQRDVEEAAAKDRLAAAQEEQRLAQERLNLYKAFIDVQTRNNELIQEQIELLKRLAEEAKKTTGGAGGAGELPDIGEGRLPGWPSEEELDAAAQFQSDLLDRKLQELEDIANQADPFEGLFSNLETNFNTTIDSIVEGVDGIVGDIEAAFAPLFEEDGAFDQFVKAWGEVGGLLDELLPDYKAFVNLSEELQKYFQVDVFRESGFDEWLQSLAESSQNIDKENLNFVGGLMLAISEIVVGLGTAQAAAGFLGINRFLEDLALFVGIDPNALGALGEALDGIAGEAFVDAILTMAGPLGIFVKALKELGSLTLDLQDVRDFFESLREFKDEKILPVINDALERLSPLLDLITGKTPKATKNVGALGKSARDAGGDFNLFNILIDTFLGKTTRRILTFVGDSIKDLGQWALDMIAKGGEAASGFLTELKNMVSDVIDPGQLLENLGKEAERLLRVGIVEYVKEKAGEIYDYFAGENGAIPNIINYIKSETILRAVYDAATAFGQKVIDGIADAIQAGISFLEQLVRDIINRLIDEADETAENGSPSRRTYETGKDLMDGIAYGIIDNARNATNAMHSVVDDILREPLGTAGINVGFKTDGAELERIGSLLLSGTGQSVAAPSRVAPSSQTTTIDFGGQTINNNMDAAVFRSLVEQVIRRAM